MGKNRIVWVDALKGFTMMFVVMGHVLLGYTENNAFPDVNMSLQCIMEWIYTWHMPMFFFLSGITFKISLFLDDGRLKNTHKWKNHILNLLIIYLFFDVSLCSLKIIFSAFVDNQIQWSQLIQSILLPSTLMWYLWVLIIYYFVFGLLLHKILKYKKGVFVFLIFFSLFAKYLFEYYDVLICIRNLLSNLLFFWIGINCKEILKIFEKRFTIFCCGMYCVCYAYLMIFRQNYLSGFMPYLQVVLSLLNTMALIYVFLWIFKRIDKKYLICFVKVGKASLVIYLVHTYIVTMIKVVVLKCNYENWLVAILLNWLVSLGISYLIYILSYKIKILGYIFKPIAIFEKEN